RIFHKLLLNFTWWVNRKDAEGNNVFEGGFLGLDNIGPLDRPAPLPPGTMLEQSDGTAWMGAYCLNLLEMALRLAHHDGTYEDLATKFFEHFAYIAAAIHERGLWDETDGFYYDVLRTADGTRHPLRVRSMVGLLPLCATTTLGEATMTRLPEFAGRFRWFVDNKPEFAANVAHRFSRDGGEGRLLAMVAPERLRRRMSHRLRHRAQPRPRRRRAGPPAGVDLPRRRRRAPPGVRRLREVPDRSGAARPDPVPRVLPRRHRHGPRGLPPDWLDRP